MPQTNDSRSAPSLFSWRVLLPGLTTVLFWGGSFTVTKALVAEWPPLTIAAARWLLAALIFAVLIPWQGQTSTLRQALTEDFWAVLRLGAIGVAFLFGVQNVALLYTTAANASVLGNLVPLFVLLLSVLFLGEPLTGRLVLAVVMGTVGAALFSLGGAAFMTEPKHLLGDGLTLLAALAGGVYVVQGKAILERYPPLTVTALAAGVGGALLAPAAILVEGLPPDLSTPGWAGLLALALGASIIAQLTWWQVADQLPANRAALFILLVPVAGAGIGVLALGDPLTPASVMGGGLILAALWLGNG